MLDTPTTRRIFFQKNKQTKHPAKPTKRPRNMFLRLGFLVLASHACAALAAQTSATDTLGPQQIEAVVITAQFVPTDARQSVNSVRVVNRQTIEQRGSVNLEELLQTDPNIRLSQDAVLGSALSINGLQGQNVKILVDGVPVVGRLNGSVDAGQLPLAAVQQVEIIEGAQSLLYGSEASAGVINLVTRKSQAHRAEAEFTPQWESNGFTNLQGRVGIRMGPVLLQVTGTDLRFEPQPDTALGRDQIWNPKQQTNARAMLRWSPSERFDLRLSGGRFSEQVDNLGELRRPQYKPYAFDDRYLTDRDDATLHAEGWTRSRWFWQGTVGYNRFDRVKNSYRFDVEDENTSLIEGQQDTSSATGWLARATLASDRRDRRWNYLFGLENYTELAEGVRIVDSTATTPGQARGNDLGLFASAKAHFFQKKLTLQGGARYTNNRLYGAAITPSAWLMWQPNAAWRVRFSYANGFRSPGLKELYFNFIDINHYVVGSTALRPERSHNLRAEATWSHALPRRMQVSATASGFYNTVRDRIILSEFAPVQYRYANLSRWETMGGGMGVTWAWGEHLRFRSDVVVTGFFNALAEGRDSLATLSWSPDWTNDLTLSALDQRVFLSVWHKMTGLTPFFYEENGQVRQGESDAWQMLNASMGGRFFKKNVCLTTGIKNLLNVQQIRSGASDVVGHSDAGMRPVHWGRTYFLTATLRLHTRA
jgi:outer membrane receptor for ferrienterochelin and colicins